MAASSQAMHQLNQPKKVVIHALDMDGCVMSTGFIRLAKAKARQRLGLDAFAPIAAEQVTDEEIREALREAHKVLIEHILATAVDGAKVYLISGSNRQARGWEHINATDTRDGRETNWASVRTLQQLHLILQETNPSIELDKLLLEDINRGNEAGTLFEWQLTHPVVGMTDPEVHETTFNTRFDEKKVLIAYVQQHHIVNRHPGAETDYHFYDDREDILNEIEGFYASNPHTSPQGTSIHLYQYLGIFSEDQQPTQPKKRIVLNDAQGQVDSSYRETFAKAGEHITPGVFRIADHAAFTDVLVSAANPSTPDAEVGSPELESLSAQPYSLSHLSASGTVLLPEEELSSVEDESLPVQLVAEPSSSNHLAPQPTGLMAGTSSSQVPVAPLTTSELIQNLTTAMAVVRQVNRETEAISGVQAVFDAIVRQAEQPEYGQSIAEDRTSLPACIDKGVIAAAITYHRQDVIDAAFECELMRRHRISSGFFGPSSGASIEGIYFTTAQRDAARSVYQNEGITENQAIVRANTTLEALVKKYRQLWQQCWLTPPVTSSSSSMWQSPAVDRLSSLFAGLGFRR